MVEGLLRTVLVVDDDGELLKLFSLVLEDEGYRVIPCQEFARAEHLIRESAPDLVILDTILGAAGGWQMLERLKRSPDTAGIPVLVCSGAADKLRLAEELFQELGCAVLHKPFDIDDLLEKIESLLLPV